MACLIANLPSYEVWVRKEYLTDHKSGHGEFVKGVWVSAKSIPGRAFYFETYLPEYAAMFDKLPISAFTSDPETPTPDESDEIETAKLIEAKDKIAMESKPFTKWR